LGRVDNQVKIRGYRIELGEIETVLSQFPSVGESVVVAREDRQSDKRLVAYVVLNQHPGTLGELRSYLEHKLPSYMLPSAIVQLEKLPLTPNGKTDRKALPLPDKTRLQLEAAYLAPSDETESMLAEIWKNVLGVNRAGTRDNFFELGGNSLLAARMFSETKRVFGKNLPLASLFQEATIEHVAALIRASEGNESTDWSSLVAIQAGGSKRPFFFIHGVGGNVLGFRGLAQLLGPDQPFYGLQAVGLNGKERPLTSVEAMAKHYVKALCRAQPEGSYLLGGLSFGGIVAFEMARQLQEQGREVACVALLDASAHLCGGNRKRRIQMHLGNLLSLSLSERLGYLRRMAKTGKRRIKSRIWKVGYELYRYKQDQLPKTLQNVKEINYQAAREYAIGPYPGRVALFRASDRPLLNRDDDLLGWDQFTAGVDLYRVPGDHLSMINEPHVRQLAEQLKLCFSRALQPDAALEAGQEEVTTVK
jgi:thioesterase domain-containing protein/acyl carrier protein